MEAQTQRPQPSASPLKIVLPLVAGLIAAAVFFTWSPSPQDGGAKTPEPTPAPVVVVDKGPGQVTPDFNPDQERFGGLSDVRVSDKTISILFVDHGAADGDIVGIYLNGVQVGEDITLGKVPTQRRLSLKGGINKVEVVARNEGGAGPNTATIQISDVTAGKGNQQYNLKTGETATFLVQGP